MSLHKSSLLQSSLLIGLKPQRCGEPTCDAPGDVLPVLFVPPAIVSAYIKCDGIRSYMGFPFCQRHFTALQPRNFLDNEAVVAAIKKAFAAKMATPDFKRATVVPATDAEMQEWLTLQMQRQGTKH